MFEHSVPVPRLYKLAAKFAKEVKENGASVKPLLYQKKYKHYNVQALYALLVETVKRGAQIDFLLKRSQLLVKESRLDPWLARVLITELLWGKRHLMGESKPVKTVSAYQQILTAHSSDVYDNQVKTVCNPRYVRINTLALPCNEAVSSFQAEDWKLIHLTDPNNYEEFLQKASNLQSDEFILDFHIKDLLVFPPKAQFYMYNAYRNGVIVLQDKASCLPVHLLNPEPNSTVLDMCAAPGMKTSHMAAMMNNSGIIYAVDLDKKRFETLEELVQKCGVTCVKAIHQDVLTITEKDCPGVEYILVDPSCSGSGIPDRLEIENYKSNDENRLEKLAGFQIKILKHALRSFPNAKRVVYSTCSVHPEENEAVVKDVLQSCGQFKLVSADGLLNAQWLSYASPEYGDVGKFCLYARPETDLTCGFFVAVFERVSEGERNPFFVENLKGKNGYEQRKEEKKSAPKKRNKFEKEVERQDMNGDSEEIKNKRRKMSNADEHLNGSEGKQSFMRKVAKKDKKFKIATEAQGVIGCNEVVLEERKNKKARVSRTGEQFGESETKAFSMEKVLKKHNKFKKKTEPLCVTDCNEEVCEERENKKGKTNTVEYLSKSESMQFSMEKAPKKHKKSKKDTVGQCANEKVHEGKKNKNGKGKSDTSEHLNESKSNQFSMEKVPKKHKKSKKDTQAQCVIDCNEVYEGRKNKKCKFDTNEQLSESGSKQFSVEKMPKKRKKSKKEIGPQHVTDCNKEVLKGRHNKKRKVSNAEHLDEGEEMKHLSVEKALMKHNKSKKELEAGQSYDCNGELREVRTSKKIPNANESDENVKSKKRKIKIPRANPV